MVSKKNFPQSGGRVNQQQRQMPYKKPHQKPPMINNFNNNPMFNVSQIPDNPGYLDFNLPTPPNTSNNSAPNGNDARNGNNNNNNVNNRNANNGDDAGAKKKNNKNKPKNNKPPGAGNGPNLGWKNGNHPQGGGMSGGPNNSRFNGGGGPRNFNHQMITRRGNRMMPPMGGPRMGMGPMGPPMPHMGFQPPMMPPMPPMGRGGPPMPPPMGVQPPPPFMRRGNGPMPPPIPPMMPPRMPRGLPPAPFIAGGPGNGKIKKNKPIKKVTKGKSTIKTLKNLINQYPIDKPWVTAEIREEHDKKIDIENRLKGNKDDELFAQFKVQRDKFVGLYETAREEYLKKEAAAVKAKDEKDKQTNTNTAKKDDKKEANKNENKKN